MRVNKAFVREPDEPDDVHCPACGAIGQAVSADAVKRQLPEHAGSDLAHGALYCPSPRCAVGYFDAVGRTVAADALREPIYPKPRDAPVCLCTGVTADDIVADARNHDPTRVRAILARCREHGEQCATRTPNERPCEATVQQLYLRTIQGR
jgi:hypothetical protein